MSKVVGINFRERHRPKLNIAGINYRVREILANFFLVHANFDYVSLLFNQNCENSENKAKQGLLCNREVVRLAYTQVLLPTFWVDKFSLC